MKRIAFYSLISFVGIILTACTAPAYMGDNASIEVNIYTSATPNQAP